MEETQELINEGATDEARRKLKALDSVERGLADDGDTPNLSELNAKLESVDDDQDLEDIFPSTFAALTDGVDSGGGIRINLGSDDLGLPAQYVPEDEIDEDDDVYLYTEKNIHGRYAYGMNDDAKTIVPVKVRPRKSWHAGDSAKLEEFLQKP